MLYRYELIKQEHRIGILAGLDDFFNDSEIISLSWVFERDLPDPCISMSNTESYFTEKGNRKFKKGIRRIQKLAESKGIKFSSIVVNEHDLNDVLYSDDYQVIILK